MMSKPRMLRKVSSAFVRDPAHMKRITLLYENTLLHMWRNALQRIRAEVFERRMAVNQVVVERVSTYDPQRDIVQVGVIIDAEVLAKAPAIVRKGVRQSYTAGNQRGTAFLGSVGVRAEVGLGPADERTLEVLEARNLAELTKLRADVAAQIQQDIAEGIRRGEQPTRQTTKRIVERRIDGVGKVRARMIARTETMYAYNAAADEQYRRHGIENIEWLAAYDERVCDHSVRGFDGRTYPQGCMGLQGAVFPIDEAPPAPLHPNCRCVRLPSIKEVRR